MNRAFNYWLQILSANVSKPIFEREVGGEILPRRDEASSVSDAGLAWSIPLGWRSAVADSLQARREPLPPRARGYGAPLPN